MYIKKGETNTHPVLAWNKEYVQVHRQRKRSIGKRIQETYEEEDKRSGNIYMYTYIYIINKYK